MSRTTPDGDTATRQSGAHWYAVVAVAITLAATYYLVTEYLVVTRVPSRSTTAKNDIKSLMIVADLFRDRLAEDELQLRFDRVLNGEVAAEDAFQFPGLEIPLVDPWGNRYLTTPRPNKNEEPRLHFYSLGADGESRSAGNDDDDLRSW